MIRTTNKTSLRGKIAGFSAIFATMSSGLLDAGPFDGPVEPANGTRRAVHRTESPPPVSTHRLTYLNAAWEKVLNDLSEDSGKQLIMSEIPPGQFTRRDFVPHSTRETVQILNQELERRGFRILEQGDYLIVLNLASVRTRYERSTIAPQGTGVKQVSDQHITNIDPPRRPVRRFTEVTITDTPDRVTTADGTYPPEATASAIRQTAHDIAAPDVSRQSQPVVRRNVQPETSVVEVAKYLHESFGKSSQLIDAGPGGHPAFQVEQFQGRPGTPPVSFAVGIDADENQLIIEGTQGVADQLVKSVGILDRAIKSKQEKIQIVPSKRDVKRLADELGPSMNRLLALHQQQDETQTQIQIGPGAQNGSQPGNLDSPALTSQMKGPVTIQAMPELGVLILTGNKSDVDAVMAVIKEIEKMAVGTAPSIRMHLLQNVDSSQLSTLLDTVYQDLTSRRPSTPGQPGATTAQDNRQKVTFIPVVRPNAILVIAPEGDMEGVLELVDSLDIPVEPETVFEVFTLKSAIASQAEILLTDFFADRTGLSGTISVFSDPRTNSVIVRARPIDLNEASALIRKIDRDASGALNKMKVIELKNSVAQEVSDVINQALQALMLPPGQSTTQGFGGGQAFGAAGTGETAQALREVKSVALEFLSTQGGREELVRSGILADVRITADPRINSLIVTAPAKSMGLLEALINHLDRLPSSIAEIKVFTLQNSDATRAAELLSSLFASATTTGAGGGAFGATAQTQGSGIQVAGATDISNSLVQMRFTVDIRTNSIVAVGGADALKLVEAVLLRLDQDNIRERKTAVITLKNSDATTLATTINSFLESQRALYLSTPDLVSNIELLERDVVVVPDAVTNQLMISATERYFDSIIEMIGKLDQAPPEVIIQALIVEVTLSNTDEFGIELGLQDSILFDRSTMGMMPGMPGFLFNSSNIGNNTAADPHIVGAQSLSNLGVGRTNSDAGFGGLVLSASSESVSVLIRALAARRNVQILSRPQIRTLNNIQAQIQVGQQVPVVDGFITTTTGNSPNVSQQPTGIILTVRPRINPDGTIVMETTAEKSALSGDSVPISNDPVLGVVSSPIIDQTGAQSTVSISNGHTIVMGGMITESDTTEERKVPWLGDVPLLGRAFRFDSTSSQRTELLIFLTPRVIMGDADSEYIKQVEAERLHYIEDDAEQAHGPLFGVPAEPYYFEQQGPIRLPDGSVLNPEYYPNLETQQPRQDSGIRQVSAKAPTAQKSAKPSGNRFGLKLWPFRK